MGERSAVKIINGDDDQLNSVAAEQHEAKSTANPMHDDLDGETNPNRGC
jgi:hypothetical protein